MWGLNQGVVLVATLMMACFRAWIRLLSLSYATMASLAYLFGLPNPLDMLEERYGAHKVLNSRESGGDSLYRTERFKLASTEVLSDRFSLAKVPERIDVIIIGSGVSGLLTGRPIDPTPPLAAPTTRPILHARTS